jgi:outer membrane protein assembly factor BamA
LFCLHGNAQRLQLTVLDEHSKVLEWVYRTEHSDTNSIKMELNRLKNFLHASSYLKASIDSLRRVDSIQYIARLTIGNPMKIKELRYSDADLAWLNQAELLRWKPPQGNYNHSSQSAFFQRVLIFLENHGYPFAAVSFREIILENDSFSANVIIDKGNLITIDSIVNSGSARISPSYLYRQYMLKPGSFYNEQRIANIDKKNLNLEFLRASKPSEVEFNNNKAYIRVFLDKKNASSFDGIAGIMPNQSGERKTLLTGDINIRLLNSFGRAEQLELSWKRLGESVSDLKTAVLLPYFLSTPFGPEYRLHIYRRDTSWVSVEHHTGVRYFFSPDRYFKLYGEWFRSNLISTFGMSTITALPPQADLHTNVFGFEVMIQEFDYLKNPRKGYRIATELSAGQKKIIKNSTINPLAYQGVETESRRYRIKGIASKYTAFGMNSTLLTSISGGIIQSDNYFSNELFRLGGLKNLRGFDEESLTASTFITAMLEYRFLLDANSFLAIFFNGAYLENRTGSSLRIDFPVGTGAGISFDTRAGLFSIYYALGKMNTNPFDVRSSKLHFGFTNAF